MKHTANGTTKICLCTHVFPDRHQCGSPALRGQALCYFHHPTRLRVKNPNERRARRIARQSFDLSAPTDRYQFQDVLSEVIARIAANQIDMRRAGLLLFALQIASSDLPTPPRQRGASPGIA
jgi:hypothetical protein